MAAPMKNATNLKAKIKPTQNDLRRLMKEKLSVGKEKQKKIDSPLAKYNNLGQLYCVLCNSEVKSEIVWTAHINGRQHKQNLDTVRQQKQLAADQKNFKKPPTPPPSVSKRKADDNEQNAKKRKVETPLPSDFFDTNVSDGNVEEMDTEPSDNVNLPKDFFDGNDQMTEIKEEETNDMKVEIENKKEALPEGFFDDPITDAKARNVEYKDPVEVEWEKFQKEIADATNIAQVIIEEEDEDSTKERQISEIDEQIHNWARVEALQRRKEELAAKQRDQSSKNLEDEMEDVDEQEFDEFLDWRSKGSWR